MVEDNWTKVYDAITQSKINVISRFQLNFRGGQSEADAEFFRNNGISLDVNWLLGLSEEELFSISNRILMRLIVAASKAHLKFAHDELEHYKENPYNDLLAQIQTLQAIKGLRPESIEGAILNILLMHDLDNTLKIISNVMTLSPDVPYSALEKAICLLAPNNPSEINYRNLIHYIASVGLTADEHEQIIDLALQKPKCKMRTHFIRFINSLVEI
ncbi:hypothetical protein DOJK_01408 [Patescibacteria group bacterium]|nr:hypothetical protein [Candidatus Dojkabacteria bacterium]CAG1022053.1 hypothetical protein DOJK_01408 [Patescibacteria group bacterium]